MKILFLCGREVSYPLNQTLLSCFRQFADVKVIAEHGRRRPIWLQTISVFLRALPSMARDPYDLIFIGFYGHLLVLMISLLKRAPILFYPFISTYETLIQERKTFSPRSPIAAIARWLDQTACRRANFFVFDTQANQEYFQRAFGVPKEKSRVILIGADEKIFHPRPEVKQEPVVLFHGSFLVLQGVDVIMEAARMLKDRTPVRFRLVGDGPGRNACQSMIDTYHLTNVDLVPSMPSSRLPEEIARAAICLGGHFGTTEKSARVIAGKTFQDLAMGKAVIVGDNPGNHELLTHGVDAWFVSMGDPASLAEGIQVLYEDSELRFRLGRNAATTFLQRASTAILTRQIHDFSEEIICQRG